MNENKKAIECGKVNDFNYILDISYPFSPLEAFSIAISIFTKNKWLFSYFINYYVIIKNIINYL